MSKIKDIKAREIIDSRANPTIEVDVILDNNIIGRSSVPSGASTGSNEALELRDKDDNRYNGKGVLKAINNVNKIKEKLVEIDISNQEKIDRIMLELDGTNNKSNLGANAILGVSLGCLKANAMDNNKEIYQLLGKDFIIPHCMINIINGGVHANNKLSFQEFMIIPMKDDYLENIRMACEVFHSLQKILKLHDLSCGVGDEGGYAPLVNSNEEALDLIIEAINKANYIPGKDICLGLDVAASEIYRDNFYSFDNKRYNSLELVNYYEKLINKYPIISIEDGMAEDDYNGWKLLTDKIGNIIQLVGDDLFVTNYELLKKGIELKIANAILIKLNQIGTVSETLKTIKLAKENNYNVIISHRSGETEDNYIADFAVGLNISWIKTGCVSRGERTSKYNRLIRINEVINK